MALTEVVSLVGALLVLVALGAIVFMGVYQSTAGKAAAVPGATEEEAKV